MVILELWIRQEYDKITLYDCFKCEYINVETLGVSEKYFKQKQHFNRFYHQCEWLEYLEKLDFRQNDFEQTLYLHVFHQCEYINVLIVGIHKIMILNKHYIRMVFPSMNICLSRQILFAREWFWTNITFGWFFTSVSL